MQAQPHFKEALLTWKRLGYRKGVHDLALRLADAVYRLEGSSREVLRLAFLSMKVGEAMGLPTTARARTLVSRVSGGPLTPELARDLTLELEGLSYGLVLRGFLLPNDLKRQIRDIGLRLA
jgi:hypothetical protein